MKYLILAVFGAGVLAGSVIYLKHAKAPATADQPAAEENISAPASDPSKAAETQASRVQTALPGIERPTSGTSKSRVALPVNAPLDRVALGQAVDLLVSNQATYEQKQATWKQLRDRGCLDQAIAELEQRQAGNPNSPEYAAVLGQAYLQKCGTISDMREQGILAMQADKLFDAALTLDSANWDARFAKAVALSYWPASMGKGEEVIQHFTTLIQQQEGQPPQPQFAEPYVWLGEQYQKAGRLDDARMVWEHGAGLFPANRQLKDKLASL